MSHRYGTRCLPTRIIYKEYEILKHEINEHKHFSDTDLSFICDDPKRMMSLKNLFEDCYELDMNEIPFRYKLKELDKIIPNFNEKVFFFYPFSRIIFSKEPNILFFYIFRIQIVIKFGKKLNQNSEIYLEKLLLFALRKN